MSLLNIKWRKVNNVIHRDIGYFFVGMSIIYGLSGIALNHLHQWDPNYVINHQSVSVPANMLETNMDEEQVVDFLNLLGIGAEYKKHYYPTGSNLKAFLKDGSIVMNINTGNGTIETVTRRKIFYEVNFLHYNHPKKLWTWFSDLFAAGLVLLAITGMFVLKGKNGLRRRGIWFVSAGIIIPVIFLILYL